MAQATRQGGELASRSSDYYRQLAGDVAASVQRQSTLGTELQTRLGAANAQSQQALGQIDVEAQARMAQDAAVRGQTNAAPAQGRVAEEVAAARSLAALSGQSAQQQGALSTYNYGNLQNLTGQATTVAGGETLRSILNQTSAQQGEIRGRQNDLAAQFASKRASNILQLRQQGFENVLAARGLDVDLAKIQADLQESQGNQRVARQRIKSAERQNRARLRVQRRGQNITARGNLITSADRRRGQDITAQQRAADRRVRQQIAASRKKQGRAETTESRKTRVGIGNALIDIRAGHEHRVRRDAPPLVYRAAREIRQVGFIRPQTVSALRNSGVRVPQSWLPPSMRRGARLGSPGIPHNKR